ncbi:hypothetical protein ACJZ2D_011491 [Fusarium nematophilum]
MDPRYLESPRFYDTISNIQVSASKSNAGLWEEIDPRTFQRLYNDPGIVMTYRCHAILVVSNETTKTGWTRKGVVKSASDFQDWELINPLWWEGSFQHTGTGQRTRNNDLAGTGLIPTREPPHDGVYWDTIYCLSERFAAPCQLRIANSLLLAVCIMCVLKCLLCILAVTVGIRRDEIPLMTPGDAIAPFIITPDRETLGMCTLGAQDLVQNGTHSRNRLRSARADLEGSRRWHPMPKRMVGRVVPQPIWILSSLFIGCSLGIGISMFTGANKEQSMYAVTHSSPVHRSPIN